MRSVLLLACLLGLSLAASLERKPHHCSKYLCIAFVVIYIAIFTHLHVFAFFPNLESPGLLTGGFTFSTQNEKAWFYAGYEYDAWQQRIRLYETGTYNNQSFTYDVLLLYGEGVMYQIDTKASKCTKQPLQADFMPLGVPPNASLLGQYVIGSSSGPGEGLLVDTWFKILIFKEGVLSQYMVTVTEFGCIPVSTLYQTKEYGWIVVSYINTIKGILDPSSLSPPSFCPGLDAKPEGTPVDFFTVVSNLKKIAV
uniref:Ependymin-like 1 n=1 Tax=Periophthalmus magnuspinnatus TaxID=409849 RepID=A0A3B4AJR8_9GOBI